MTTAPAGPQEARDVLASVEFVHGICPACSGSQPDHDDDCRIAAALSGAAVRGGAPAALREAAEALDYLLATACDCDEIWTRRHLHAPDCPWRFIRDFLRDDEIALILAALSDKTVAVTQATLAAALRAEHNGPAPWPGARSSETFAADLLRRLTAAAPSDASEEETNG